MKCKECWKNTVHTCSPSYNKLILKSTEQFQNKEITREQYLLELEKIKWN